MATPKKPGTNKQSGKINPMVFTAKLKWRFIGIIFVSAFLLYANTLKHDYSLDDDIYTKKNRFIQEGFSALPDIFNKGSLVGFNNANESNYRPLVLLNFMISTSFFGNNPHVEHFFNVVFYGLSCVMLLLVLQKMFKKYNPLVPLAITLVFVFHPVHTEVVASIKSRDEILGWLFGVSSFYYLLCYAENVRLNKNLIWSVAFFFSSILFKENSLTFIIIIPLLLYFFTDLPVKKIASIFAPFGVLILIYMAVRASTLDNITFKDKIIIMNNGLMAAKTTGDMLATNFVILGKYIWLLVFPVDLTWDYSYAQVPIVSFSNWKALLSIALYLGMGAYVLLRFKHKDVYVFAILFFLITIFLSSNLVVKIGATMGERFLFAPSLGFCIALVLILFEVLKIDPAAPNWPNKSTLFALLGGVLFLYSFKTVDRNKVWKNNFELFNSGLEVSTGSARAHFAVASECRVKGEGEPDQVKRGEYFKKSVEEYYKGIAIYADDAEVWYNLGVTYFDMGDTANARKVYAKALELRPNYSMALNNTGVLYFNLKNYDKALKCFTKILETDTNFLDAYGNIGAAYHNTGNYQLAVKFYEKALQRNPNNKSMLSNAALAYKTMGDTVRSTMYSQRAAVLK
jgi:hypothetical protein